VGFSEECLTRREIVQSGGRGSIMYYEEFGDGMIEEWFLEYARD
jgi:hypothetical protein